MAGNGGVSIVLPLGVEHGPASASLSGGAVLGTGPKTGRRVRPPGAAATPTVCNVPGCSLPPAGWHTPRCEGHEDRWQDWQADADDERDENRGALADA